MHENFPSGSPEEPTEQPSPGSAEVDGHLPVDHIPDNLQGQENPSSADLGEGVVQDGVIVADDGTEVRKLHRPKNGFYDDPRPSTENLIQDPAKSDYFVKQDYASPAVAVRRLPLDEAHAVAVATQDDWYARRKLDELGKLGRRRDRLMQERQALDEELERLGDAQGDYRREHGDYDPRISDQASELRGRSKYIDGSMPRDHQFDSLRKDLNRGVDSVEWDTLGFFRLNPERFSKMPAAEFLEQVNQYNNTRRELAQAEARSSVLDDVRDTIQGCIDERRQVTADYLLNDVIWDRISGNSNRVNLTEEECGDLLPQFGEITNGALDRTPMETYRMCLELAGKFKERFDQKAARLAKTLDELTGKASESEEPREEDGQN